MGIMKRTSICLYLALLELACAPSVFAADQVDAKSVSMAVVARNAMARFRVDLSARLFRHDGRDAFVHDETRAHGLHVAGQVDG